ncbi:unnamed protein product [Malus baccata var. baccata]
MNFFTIEEMLRFEGLDLTMADEEAGCLSFLEDEGSEKCEDVEERASYELYHDEGFCEVGFQLIPLEGEDSQTNQPQKFTVEVKK